MPTMWRRIAVSVAGIVAAASIAALAYWAVGGTSSGGNAAACGTIDLSRVATRDARVPSATLEIARKVVDFPIYAPTDLSDGALIGNVSLEYSATCPDRVDRVVVPYRGRGYVILIEEGRFSIEGKTAQPIRIHGTDGLVDRGENRDPNFVVVSWKNGKVSYSAAVTWAAF